jgi:hypothetical protein
MEGTLTASEPVSIPANNRSDRSEWLTDTRRNYRHRGVGSEAWPDRFPEATGRHS